MALRKRLLHDIKELQTDPYPNIELHMWDDKLQGACLLLAPPGGKNLHLTIVFGSDYPLKAPEISMNSTDVRHPNVFHEYICASILNTAEGWTPAYTLKGIAIQLLSFFCSERLEQVDGNRPIDLEDYRDWGSATYSGKGYKCKICGFGGDKIRGTDLVIMDNMTLPDPFRPRKAGKTPEQTQYVRDSDPSNDKMDLDTRQPMAGSGRSTFQELLLALPNEILLQVLQELDTHHMLAVAQVSRELGDFMSSNDSIRMREQQCFLFKENFLSSKLGVGVHIITGRSKQGMLESEFDLLSQQAFQDFRVRRSVQGLGFSHWLPLPISRRHWRSVRVEVHESLLGIAGAANINTGSISSSATLRPEKPGRVESSGFTPKMWRLSDDGVITVIYAFMNDVVVKLSREAEKSWHNDYRWEREETSKSTLTHASEKAIESYFGLFHLLLCLATEHREIVDSANRRLKIFMEGHTSKDACPNLGHLLVAVLISDQGLTEDLITAIIDEAILRNVVWMLDARGAGMAELSYIEPTPISEYRLQRTFDASKVSYRLLMFLALFYKTARVPGQSISAICDELFDRHGAPPKGAAETMAAEIRKIRQVDNFQDFFAVMGVKYGPDKEELCGVLKETIQESVRQGYSRHALSAEKALALRRPLDPDVEVKKGVFPWANAPNMRGFSFFPNKKKGGRQRW